MRALVVEDTPEILEVVAEFLREDGWQVDVAASGCEAWDILATHSREFTLLLTDVVMPGLSGIELAERVKDAYPGIRILLMSGYADGYKLNGLTLLRKPFRHIDLNNAISQVLHSEC